MRRTITKSVLVFAGLLLASCGSSSVGTNQNVLTTTTGAASKPAAGTKVAIRNFAFVPANLTVKPNSIILVTNDDAVIHTFTAQNNSFNSGNILPGQTVAVKVGNVSTGVKIAYYCSIHQYMTGTVTIGN